MVFCKISCKNVHALLKYQQKSQRLLFMCIVHSVQCTDTASLRNTSDQRTREKDL